MNATVTTATTAATCDEAGKTVYTASATFEEETYTDAKEVTIAKLGHNWGEADYTWTKIANGYRVTGTVACTNDETHVNTETVIADLTTDTPATCEEDGLKVYTATFTKAGLSTQTKNVPVDALGHDYQLTDWTWTGDDENGYTAAVATFTCSRDNTHVETVEATVTSDVTQVAHLTDGVATYTATATFEGKTYTDTKTVTTTAPGHTIVEVGPKAAKCLIDGNKAYTWCPVCGVILTIEEGDVEAHGWTMTENSDKVILPATGHNYGAPVWSWTGNDADGYTAATATFTCRNDSTHAVELTDSEIEVNTSMDDCTVGATTVYTASVTFENVAYRDTVTVIGAATGHTIKHQAAKPNSCVEDGNIEYWYCEVCHRVFLDEAATQNVAPFTVLIPVDPTAHDWDETVYVWNQAHTKVTATRICKNDATHVETETVDATYGVVTPATCEAVGLGRYTSEEFENEAFEVQTQDTEIPATGHTPSDVVEAVAPTCVDKGNLSYVYCTVCNKLLNVNGEDVSENGWYKGVNTDKYVLDEDETNHADLVTDAAVDSTCTETGLTEGQHCAACGTVTIAQNVTPALGHSFTGDIHDNQNGTHSGTCERCGAFDEAEECTYGDWEIVTGETCIAEGSRRHTCTVCGHVEYEIIGVASHKLWKTRARTAYCTQDGNIEYYTCSECKKIFRDAQGTTEITLSETVIPAIGHNFTGQIHDNADGTHSYLCVNGCGTYGLVKDGVQKPVSDGGRENHVFDREVQTRDYLCSLANCYEPIKYYKSCACGAKGTDTFTVGTELGHSWLNFPEQKATCLQAGHTAYTECQRCHKQEGYTLIGALGHGAYNYDASKSGASSDGSIKWEAYSCANGCGDYYMKTTITSLDANGTRVPNVNVRIVDSAGRTVVNDKTNGNGDLTFGTSYRDSLHPGRYDVYLEYVRDGGNYNTHGTITFADGKVSGSFGKLTPYGGNASGSIGGKPTSGFRCSMCDLNDSMKNKPVIGWFISIIHAIVHAISRITRR